jgi:hypothetical protein
MYILLHQKSSQNSRLCNLLLHTYALIFIHYKWSIIYQCHLQQFMWTTKCNVSRIQSRLSSSAFCQYSRAYYDKLWHMLQCLFIYRILSQDQTKYLWSNKLKTLTIWNNETFVISFFCVFSFQINDTTNSSTAGIKTIFKSSGIPFIVKIIFSLTS